MHQSDNGITLNIPDLTQDEADMIKSTRIRVARNFAKFPEVKGSTKKYLSSQMGPMFKVYPAHWKSAIFLPVQQFAGGVGLQKIYRETMAKPKRKRKGGIGGF